MLTNLLSCLRSNIICLLFCVQLQLEKITLNNLQWRNVVWYISGQKCLDSNVGMNHHHHKPWMILLRSTETLGNGNFLRLTQMGGIRKVHFISVETIFMNQNLNILLKLNMMKSILGFWNNKWIAKFAEKTYCIKYDGNDNF